MKSVQRYVQLKPQRDTAIAKWAIMIKNSWRGGIAILTKQAIRQFMKDGTFSCIGKVHKVDDDTEIIKEQPALSLNFTDSKDIRDWFEVISNNGIEVATIIREILRKSILVVDETEDEWIPSCLDVCDDSNVLDVLKRLNITGHGNGDDNQMQKENEVKPTVVPTVISPNVEKAQEKSLEKPKFPIKTPEKTGDTQKKIPRAAALSGKRFTS